MKKISAIILSGLIFMSLPAISQTKADSTDIEKTCRDYVEGWAEGNTERVASAVSPELVKRTVMTGQTGDSFTINMSSSQLVMASAANKGGVRMRDLTPGEDFKLDVRIFDIMGDFALAKTFNAKYGFFDYCQLAKFNGDWKIINVLWGMQPQ
jgi:hypothetical protein